MSNLDREEKELLNSVENNEWQSVENIELAKSKYKNYAQNQPNQTKISVTLTIEDIEKINQLADKLNKPVSIISQEILHKYLQGELVEKTA